MSQILTAVSWHVERTQLEMAHLNAMMDVETL